MATSGMMDPSSDIGNFHVVTPLIHSRTLSKVANTDVFLKLDNLQPTASYKLRGMGRSCQKKAMEGYTRFVGSSGGNAGLAMAWSSRLLGIPMTVYVPNTTSVFMRQKIQAEGVELIVHGKNWDEANEEALLEAQKPGVALIHPYDDPDAWEGNATVVTEIANQLKRKPAAIVLSVGGGGLIMGVLKGLEEFGWCDVPVVAMETKGADCFNQSVQQNKLVVLPAITSIATTLGALSVTPKLMEILPDFNVISEVITDEEALDGCIHFADDHRMLVELACGASLAAVYSGILLQLEKEGKLSLDGPVVVIVCGGSAVTLNILEQWKQTLAIKPSS